MDFFREPKPTVSLREIYADIYRLNGLTDGSIHIAAQSYKQENRIENGVFVRHNYS